MNPPFRAEQIGSLLRPEDLKQAMRARQKSQVTPQELRAIQDRAVDAAIREQEALGFQVVTDGEFRRTVYFSYFYVEGLGGIDYEEEGERAWRYRDRGGHEIGASRPVVRRRLQWRKAINVDDFLYLKARTGRTPKVTLPGPNAVHFFAGRKNIDETVYPELDQFFDDVVDALRREIQALAEAGCTYVQIDETALAKFGDAAIRETLAARGDSWEKLLDLYIDNLNRVLVDAPKGVTLGVHMCRGNRQGHWQAEGGYEAAAERMFNRLECGLYFMEYDSPRAGDFAPLRHLPKGKHVVLGLISSKVPELEPMDDLRRRIDEAARYVPLDNLAISPQCGFASDFVGNPVTEEQQRAKLRLVIDVAKRVWGSA